MGKLGKPEKTREKKKSEDEEIDFPSEEISPAMYRKKNTASWRWFKDFTELQEKNQNHG